MGLKYRVNEEFFDTWSDEMAYVLGFMFADGHVIDAPSVRAKYVCVSNTDRDRIESIKKLLNSAHVVRIRPAVKNSKPMYILRIGSARMYTQLLRLGITPRKSNSMQFPDVPTAYVASFIRGYFDGDGCVHLSRNGSGAVNKLLTVFTSGSKKFLDELGELLGTRIGMSHRNLYPHGSAENAYQIRYATRDSLRLFSFIYNPGLNPVLFLKRKYDIFNAYLEIKGLQRSDIPLLLNTKGPVAK